MAPPDFDALIVNKREPVLPGKEEGRSSGIDPLAETPSEKDLITLRNGNVAAQACGNQVGSQIFVISIAACRPHDYGISPVVGLTLDF